MTQDQTLIIGWVVGCAGRIPRIVERWKAPFLNGPGWFFGVQVPSDFLAGGGQAILAAYRRRLFVPWAVELPLTAALWATGHPLAILPVIAVITLLTRLNYYADRQTAEHRARRFESPAASEPQFTISLSLQPRTLAQYTKGWVEATILLVYTALLAHLVWRYLVLEDWHPMRGVLSVTLLSIYLQGGALLAKRAFVRARSSAPAVGAEQYLAWRESLRRLSTTLCDYIRLMLLSLPVLADLVSLTDHWQGSPAQTVSIVAALSLAVVLVWFEWRDRRQHLHVTREARPAGFLVRPDTADTAWPLCYRPALPMLLLKGPRGYSLNLASAPARTAGLYLAGCALLLVFLTR
jgi:hypothetical protein